MFKVKLDIVREHELHLGDAIIRSKALAETVPSVVTEIEWKYLPDKSGIQGFAEGRWFDAIMIVTGKLARFTLQVRCNALLPGFYFCCMLFHLQLNALLRPWKSSLETFLHQQFDIAFSTDFQSADFIEHQLQQYVK